MTWRIENRVDGWTIIDIDGSEDRWVTSSFRATADDARLIASAPDLLVSLERIATDLALYPADASANDLRSYLDDVLEEAREAIGKVAGP